MSMPKISDINPNININREDAVNVIIMSIAMEELSIAHILNAEGEKLQYVLGTLDGKDPGDDITICDIMAVNKSIQKTLRNVIKTEMLLQLKLEGAAELAESENECQLTIKGQKIWRDGNNVYATRPPSVEIRLLRNGVVVDTRTVYGAGDGRFTFACLPVSNNAGQKYTYTIDETAVPTGYTKTISGFDVINTALPGSRNINGTKTWVDANNVGGKRPANVTVNLLRNGVQIESKTVTSPTAPNNTVPFSFDGVPQFDNEGSPFVYTVGENDVAGYEKSINGFNITNTLL